MLGDSNGSQIDGVGMTYGYYLGMTQINSLKVIYHPIYKYYIGNDEHYRYDQDSKIANQIALTKKQYQEILIENFKAKAKSSNVYFGHYDDAVLALGWIDSMRTMQKLRVSK